MENKTEDAFSLLDEFATPTREQWLALASAQLKGASFEEALVTDTPEGISKRPIYAEEDMESLGIALPNSGKLAHIRETAALPSIAGRCKTGILLNGDSPSQLNRLLRKLPERENALLCLNPAPNGAGRFRQRIASGGIPLQSVESLSKLLEEVEVSSFAFCLDAGKEFFPCFALLASYLRKQSVSLDKTRGNVINDLYSMLLLQEGPLDAEGYWRKTASLLKWSRKNTPHWSVLGVDGRIYHECGGNIVQEIAFSLASAVETVRELTKRGFSADTACSQIHFNLSIGSDFFMEIAKLRAMRSLWAQIQAAYNIDNREQVAINTFSSRWNKTLYDPHTNILRATTETLGALLGGADTVCLHPFDFLTEKSEELSSRLAQNIPCTLREEGFCDKVLDPAGGSWMVESLTHQLGQKAWSLFQKIEGEGGIIEAIQKGTVQNQIESNTQSRRKAFEENRAVAVGTNRFGDPAEIPREILVEKARPFEPGEKTRGREETLSKLAQEIAEGYATDVPTPKLFDAVIEAFQTGATLDDIELELDKGASGFKTSRIANHRPLYRQRATEQVERLRRERKSPCSGK